MIAYKCPSCGQAGECSDFLAHMAIHCKKCYHSIPLTPASKPGDSELFRQAKKIVETATSSKPNPSKRPGEAISPTDLFLFTTGFSPSDEDQSLAIQSLVQLNPSLPASELNALELRIDTLPGNDRQTLLDSALKRAARSHPEARLAYAVRENHTPGEHMVIVAVWPASHARTQSHPVGSGQWPSEGPRKEIYSAYYRRMMQVIQSSAGVDSDEVPSWDEWSTLPDGGKSQLTGKAADAERKASRDIQEKYGISAVQLAEICQEGRTKRWRYSIG